VYLTLMLLLEASSIVSILILRCIDGFLRDAVPVPNHVFVAAFCKSQIGEMLVPCAQFPRAPKERPCTGQRQQHVLSVFKATSCLFFVSPFAL
jgi:hypothetical protein